ncbi:membrane protein [Tamlana sedimentorum]|uniref:Membrane protein n=1 Tax=Neotamlana sedimentorum TaxID=1435349 RepID=A0A0D7W791_9FLAO|nr:MerC domain-containing protein [Tamlana sedimentorum]KJD35001.1 membrane protein [Tamlana sedimentorum]
MKTTLYKPDSWGAMASFLCLIHCLLTPFLFIAQTSVAACCATETVPVWWQSIDFVFIVISFFAVYQSTKNSTNNAVKKSFWVCWGFLFFLIVNEKLEWLSIPELVMYAVAITMVILHIYNLKYCQCKTDNCCINNE